MVTLVLSLMRCFSILLDNDLCNHYCLEFRFWLITRCVITLLCFFFCPVAAGGDGGTADGTADAAGGGGNHVAFGLSFLLDNALCYQ